MSGSISKDLGLSLGRVYYDEDQGRAKVSQKVGGIDIKEYVDHLKEAKLFPTRAIKDRIETTDKTLTALETFKEKLEAVRTAASPLTRRLSSPSQASKTVFSKYAVTSSTEDVFFNLSSKAVQGSFTFQVNQLATADVRKLEISAPDLDTALGIGGSFTISTTGAESQETTITLDPTTTLRNLKEQIQNAFDATTVQADIIQTKSGSPNNFYQLKLKAKNTGEPIILKNSSGTPLSSLGLNALSLTEKNGIIAAASQGTGLGLSGSLTFQGGGASDVTIMINASTTLNDIVSSINSVQAATGVSASLERVSKGDASKWIPPQYQLKLLSTDPMDPNVPSTTPLILSASGGLLDGLGLNSPVTSYQRLAAIVTCDDTTFYRASNTINGEDPDTAIMNGVTIYLNKASGELYHGYIGIDKEAFITQFDAFVTAYNDLMAFYAEQTKTDLEKDLDENISTKGAEGADLYGNRAAEKMIRSLKNSLTQYTAANSTGYATLRNLGYSIQPNGTLGHTTPEDEKTYINAVNNNFDKIEAFFSTKVSHSESAFDLLSVPDVFAKNFQGQDFTVSFSQVNGALMGSVTVNGDTYEAEVFFKNGKYELLIEDNGPLDGFRVQYHGALQNDGPVKTDVINISQGLMDQVDGALSLILDDKIEETDPDTEGTLLHPGIFTQEVESKVQSKKKDLEKIKKLQKEAADLAKLKEKEFQKAYEASIKLETIMSMIESFNTANRR